MAVPLFVPDASVILKWALMDAEEDRTQALALKAAWLEGSAELVVPSLWAFEVGNVLGRSAASHAEALLDALFDLALPEAPAPVYTGAALRLMRDYLVTFYDAAYHAVAIARGGTMLTADRRYLRKVQPAGHIVAIDQWRAQTSSR